MDLMGIKDTNNIYFSYSRDDVMKFLVELSTEGDEIYENYLSHIGEEQPIGEIIASEMGDAI